MPTEITNDQINKLYHKHVAGKCVKHEWRQSDPDNKKTNVTSCKNCSAQFNYYRKRPSDYVPDYMADAAVVLREVEDLLMKYDFHIMTDPMNTVFGVESCLIDIVIQDKSLPRGVLLAGLQRRGVKIDETS